MKGQPAAVPSNPAEGEEILLAVWDDGSVTALHGHVDLKRQLTERLHLRVRLPAAGERLHAEADPRMLAPRRTEKTPLPGGGFVLRHPEPLQPYTRCVGAWLEHWAVTTPDAVSLLTLGHRFVRTIPALP